jgi:carboxyl-terminal processing protease
MLATLVTGVLAFPCTGPATQQSHLLDRVVRVLERDYYSTTERREHLPELVARLRAREDARSRSGPESLVYQRTLVQELLESLDASHLALYSRASYEAMEAELTERPMPTLGLQLVEEDDRYYADWIYEDGPADRAGILRGEEVLAIDGIPTAKSPRLDWRTDDAALPDPPIHAVLCKAGEKVSLAVSDARGTAREVSIRVRAYSGADASRASARIYEIGPLRVGYVHLWFMSASTPVDLVRDLLAKDFRDCDALILDLRGRGGYAAQVGQVARLFDAEHGGWNKPLVALIHAGTRSAKEILAWTLRNSGHALLVGEHTAGAVVPASFADVGDGAVLMYPAATLGAMTERLEGKGVEPDVPVAAPLADAGGEDPILSAALVAARVWCETRAEALLNSTGGI